MSLKRLLKVIIEVILLNEIVAFIRGFIDGYKASREYGA